MHYVYNLNPLFHFQRYKVVSTLVDRTWSDCAGFDVPCLMGHANYALLSMYYEPEGLDTSEHHGGAEFVEREILLRLAVG